MKKPVQFFLCSVFLINLNTNKVLAGTSVDAASISSQNICEVKTTKRPVKTIGRFIYQGQGQWLAQNNPEIAKNRLRVLGQGSVQGLYELLVNAGSFMRFNRINSIFHNPKSMNKIKNSYNGKEELVIVSDIATSINVSHGRSLPAGSEFIQFVGKSCHLFWRAQNDDNTIIRFGEIPLDYKSDVLNELAAMLFLENIIKPNEELLDLDAIRAILLK